MNGSRAPQLIKCDYNMFLTSGLFLPLTIQLSKYSVCPVCQKTLNNLWLALIVNILLLKCTLVPMTSLNFSFSKVALTTKTFRGPESGEEGRGRRGCLGGPHVSELIYASIDVTAVARSGITAAVLPRFLRHLTTPPPIQSPPPMPSGAPGPRYNFTHQNDFIRFHFRHILP